MLEFNTGAESARQVFLVEPGLVRLRSPLASPEFSLERDLRLALLCFGVNQARPDLLKSIVFMDTGHFCASTIGPVLKDAEDSPDVHDAGLLAWTRDLICLKYNSTTTNSCNFPSNIKKNYWDDMGLPRFEPPGLKPFETTPWFPERVRRCDTCAHADEKCARVL